MTYENFVRQTEEMYTTVEKTRQLLKLLEERPYALKELYGLLYGNTENKATQRVKKIVKSLVKKGIAVKRYMDMDCYVGLKSRISGK